MSSSRTRSAAVTFAAITGGFLFSCERPQATVPCELTPAEFARPEQLRSTATPPSSIDLPASGGRTTSTLMEPAPRHRWDPKTGFVETLDGSVLLHGVLRVPPGSGRLHITTLVDYEPASAEIRVWSADRRQVRARGSGPHFLADVRDADVAFDLELPPSTVPTGTWRELQTVVLREGASPDVRRWTLYAGPSGPRSQKCSVGGPPEELEGRRTMLLADGRFRVSAKAIGTIAVVPITVTGPGEPTFVRFDAPAAGFSTRFEPAPRLAAVWPSPFGGPGTDWISSFWTVGVDSAVQQAVREPDVR